MAFLLLALLVFTIPWEKSIVVPGVGTLTKLIGAGAFVASLPRWRSFHPTLLFAMLSAFVLWCGLTWFWSLDPGATLARVLTLLQLIVLFVLVSLEHRTRTLMMAYSAGAAVACLLAVGRYFLGMQTNWRRYAAPGFDPNDFGITIAIAIPLALYALPGAAGRAAVVLYGLGIVLSASRSALIAASLALILTAVFWRGQRVAALALLLLLAAGSTVLAPPAARERISTTTTELVRGTLHGRTVIWKAGLRAWRSRPLTGSGAGTFPLAVRPLIGVPGRAGHEYVAHNVALSVLVETGLAGFAIFVAAAGVLALFVWALPDLQRVVLTIAFLVWLVGAATLTWEHRKPTWLLPGFVCSLWLRAGREETS